MITKCHSKQYAVAFIYSPMFSVNSFFTAERLSIYKLVFDLFYIIFSHLTGYSSTSFMTTKKLPFTLNNLFVFLSFVTNQMRKHATTLSFSQFLFNWTGNWEPATGWWFSFQTDWHNIKLIYTWVFIYIYHHLLTTKFTKIQVEHWVNR